MKTILRIGKLRMNLLKRQVTYAGRSILLTKTEFDLLSLLMRRPGHVLSQPLLTEHLSGHDFFPTTNIIEVHIKHLRDKLRRRSRRDLIRTVRGCGYAIS